MASLPFFIELGGLCFADELGIDFFFDVVP